jgi:hypothetical protein
MENQLYQNSDLSQENPFTPLPVESKKKFTLPKNPKIIALMVMGVLIFILGIVAIVVSSINSGPPPITIKPFPTSSVSPVPTLGYQNIPTQYVERFAEIDKEINTNQKFYPPEIDPNIGSY